MTDSNRRHLPCKGSALPTELIARFCAETVPSTQFDIGNVGGLARAGLGVNEASFSDFNGLTFVLPVKVSRTQGEHSAQSVPFLIQGSLARIRSGENWGFVQHLNSADKFGGRV